MLSFTKIVQFGIEKSWKFKVKQTFGKKTVIAKLSQLVLYRAEISLFPSFSPPATGKVLPSLVECCSSAIILLGIMSFILFKTFAHIFCSQLLFTTLFTTFVHNFCSHLLFTTIAKLSLSPSEAGQS